MSSNIRKSILNIQNIELLVPEQSPQYLKVPEFESPDHKYSFTPSPKSPFRPSIFKKMQRLNVMKVSPNINDTRCLTGFKTKTKPNICISELWGAQEKYLRKTSFLEAYKELKKVQEVENSLKIKTSRKIEKPHIEDYQAKVKVLKNSNTTPIKMQKQLATIYEKNNKKINEGASEKLDFIIQKCSEITKGKLCKTRDVSDIIDLNETGKKKVVVGTRLSGISSSKLIVKKNRG